MDPIFLVGLIVVSVALIVWALMPQGKNDGDAVQRRLIGGSKEVDMEDLRNKARDSVTKRVVEKVAPFAVKPAMPKDDASMSKLRVKLSCAGFRSDNAPTLFLASKSLCALVLALIALLVCLTKGMGAAQIASYSIFAAGLGFMGPNLWLGNAATKRGQKIKDGLPDSLDLMVISVEAGLALDAAIQRVGDEMQNVHPELSEEFRIATFETQMGLPRSEALEKMADRSGVPEMRSLIAIVNQAEKFGTSIASALRNQSDALRVKRRQAAEEAAQKTTVKLMLPLMFFIFPAIFVVLAGPAALRLIDTLKGGSL